MEFDEIYDVFLFGPDEPPVRFSSLDDPILQSRLNDGQEAAIVITPEGNFWTKDGKTFKEIEDWK